MFSVLSVSSSGYYDWRDRGISNHAAHDALLVSEIVRMHVGHERNYGAIRVHPYLKARNYTCSRRRINRLMKAHGIHSIYHANRYRRAGGGSAAIAKNLLAERPKADAAGQHWAGDMTYLRTDQGVMYMAAVLDLFTREVIGWGFSRAHDTDLVDGALRMSLSREDRQPGCVFHSDQGSEYRSDIYRNTVKEAGMVSSMSRSGTPTDNAYVESFFKTLKNELVYHWKFKTRVECVARIVDYIEFYNADRLHSGLNYVSPRTYQILNA
jgi:transposase InsO family protein